MSDDPIRNAFASLHAEEAPRVTAPGVAAARRTVSHRRRVVAGTVASLATMLLVSAGYLAAAGAGIGPAGDSGPVPEVVAGDEPSPLPDELDNPPGGLGGDGPALAEALWGSVHDLGPLMEVGSGPGNNHPIAVDAATFEVEAGAYRIRVACTGSGSLVIKDLSGAGGAAGTVECGFTPDQIAAGIGEVSVNVPQVDRDAEGRIIEGSNPAVLSLTLDEASGAEVPVVGFDLIPA